jgi:hypothetical protein
MYRDHLSHLITLSVVLEYSFELDKINPVQYSHQFSKYLYALARWNCSEVSKNVQENMDLNYFGSLSISKGFDQSNCQHPANFD